MKNHFLKSLLPLSLSLLVVTDQLPLPAFGQNLPVRIDVVVVEGEGLTTNVRERVAHDPAVRIEDDDHRPVAGAVVVFALPVSGTSGEFPNGTKSLTVVTDKDGMATASGLKTNDMPGRLQIYVMANYHGVRAMGLINQTVTIAPGAKAPAPELHTSKSGGKWKWVLLGIAAAAGAGAGIYFTRKGSSSPVSIGTGTVVFGGPH